MSQHPPLRIAVVGAGNLGRHHARLLAESPSTELVAVVDILPERAEAVAGPLGVPALTDFRTVLDQVEAISVVTPTRTHHAIAKEALAAGRHVIIEKPITSTVAQARDLIEVAESRNLTLQVGHVERFNAAVLALGEHLLAPRFVESHRLGPLAVQVQDVGVVLDLMIHDLDLILTLVHSPVASIDAIGVPVVTEMEDIANARLTFESGCVANVTVSRVSDRKMRKIRVFQKDGYFSLDCLKQEIQIYQKFPGEDGHPRIESMVRQLEGHNALLAELSDFAQCCRTGRRPIVSGHEALAALDLAIQINEKIASHPLAREVQ